TQNALTQDERSRLDVLLVSFDPARDTVAKLDQVFGERKLDASTWTLARTDERGVRTLSAALDIQYRALANGDVNHSTALVLLDADGRIIARSDRIGDADPRLVEALHKALVPR